MNAPTPNAVPAANDFNQVRFISSFFAEKFQS